MSGSCGFWMLGVDALQSSSVQDRVSHYPVVFSLVDNWVVLWPATRTADKRLLVHRSGNDHRCGHEAVIKLLESHASPIFRGHRYWSGFGFGAVGSCYGENPE